jgi:hypothetical protein
LGSAPATSVTVPDFRAHRTSIRRCSASVKLRDFFLGKQHSVSTKELSELYSAPWVLVN